MVIYNLGVAVVLAVAGVRSLQAGMVLWPAAVLLHAAMAIWCVVTLMNQKAEMPGLPSAGFRLTNR